jgi:hypothetical protein
MPRQNRVTPFGTLEAVSARGTLMGNRGIMHDVNGVLGTARWQHPHWIACRLAFKARRRPIMAPRSWTELFFLDEAVAFAAGHRPCAECRREDYRRFLVAWRAARGLPASSKLLATDIDRALHKERVESRTRTQITFQANLPDLPYGTFVAIPPGRDAWVTIETDILRWTHAGYDRSRPMHAVDVEVLTPRSIVEVFRAGYRPKLHPSAEAGAATSSHPKGGRGLG